MNLKSGITHTLEMIVMEKDTALVYRSGKLPVLATPAMAALMEETCWKSVAPYLEEGQGTVGTRLDLVHTAATPVGMNVTCRSELTEVDGRRLVFSVEVSDECGPIGKGTHERFIINNEKFLTKAREKGQK